MNRTLLSRSLAMMGVGSLLFATAALALPTKHASLMTRWAGQVDRNKPWPEYPRPQFVRSDWLNLNGVWEYQKGNSGDAVPTGKKLSGQILVPFAVESALSGVMEHHDRLWYRRSFTVPSGWKGKRVLLNFGAVDYESQVFVNGKSVGTHKGGYLPFSYDVTPYLKGSGPQELIVRVLDPTDKGGQPRGKQTVQSQPGGIMYTPTTGIWQTVWLEPVSRTSIQNIKIVPDIDKHLVKITVNTAGAAPGTSVTVNITASGNVIQTVKAKPNTVLSIPIAKPKLWSPDSPFLYDVDVKLAQGNSVTDHIRSYFGMRKVAIAQQNGVKKIFLNNKFLFEIGPLDQGFWPDGIYTPPTEAALKNDIQTIKTLGFNMVRKHIKVEPARWYYWTDHLGLMVWQDMPSMDSYLPQNIPPPSLEKAEFEKQLQELVKTHWNIPSIIMWVVFNEGQGQYDTPRLVNMVKALDPSRVVNQASGGGYFGAGDIIDAHSYPAPGCPAPSSTQALVCGEYGGIGWLIKGHTWTNEGGGYVTLKDKASVEETYAEFSGMLKSFRDKQGMSAAVYTQLTDVENELNGLMTYDRVLKITPATIAKANHFQYSVPVYREIVPTSEKVSQTWKYTTIRPSNNWYSKGFDTARWQQAKGGFGTDVPSHGLLGSTWTTPDIWLRRSFNPGKLTAQQIEHLVVRNYHDEDVEIYINGVLAYSAGGYTTSYESKPLSKAAKQSIVPNATNVMAVHCHQTTGGQYIDVGLSERIPAKK